MPLLLSEILQTGWADGIWTHRHSIAVFILSLKWTMVDTWKGDLPSAVVILGDQAEECPLCLVWSNIPHWSSKLMIEPRQNQLNDISSGQKIWPQLGRYNLKHNEPWHIGNLNPMISGCFNFSRMVIYLGQDLGVPCMVLTPKVELMWQVVSNCRVMPKQPKCWVLYSCSIFFLVTLGETMHFLNILNIS